jgi:hypothetical protein
VKKIVIGADHDKPGIKAAQVLVDRLSGQNVEVKAIFPDISGQDWNDVLREVSHA